MDHLDAPHNGLVPQSAGVREAPCAVPLVRKPADPADLCRAVLTHGDLAANLGSSTCARVVAY